MHTLNRNAIVPYTAEQMFALVNNIADYPHFLPWCKSSTILSQREDEIVASLEISWKGMHKTFTTRNKLYPHDRIEITLVNGPLSHLEGIWTFQPLNAEACKVILMMEFAFAGGFIDKLFQPVFQYIANTMVEAFCEHAHEVYTRD